MEHDQKTYYLLMMSGALTLALGDRNDDYNKGGVGLRDYWKINGIRSPIQMADMKLKRMLSQTASWYNGRPQSGKQLEKLLESVVDAINYCAFVGCEAISLWEDNKMPGGAFVLKDDYSKQLWKMTPDEGEEKP